MFFAKKIGPGMWLALFNQSQQLTANDAWLYAIHGTLVGR